MRKLFVFVFPALLLALALVHPQRTLAQSVHPTRPPIQVGAGYLESQGAKVNFKSNNKMTPQGKAAMQQNQIISVRTFTQSFTFQGTVFPYTMVGNDPTRGGPTFFDTQLIPISFFFDEFVDQNGNNIVIDANPIVPTFLNSPNFQPSNYTSGFTQFGDAVQRAEFFNVAQPSWRNLLERPEILPTVQVEVPVGSALVFQSTVNGTIFALIDFGFMASQLNTIVQLEPLRVDSLPIALTRNALFFDGSPNQCCTLGFHTAFETKSIGPLHFVQTFAFATWPEAGIFVNPDFSDAIAISHEISEWMNDPFANNVVPTWQSPSGQGCSNLLETGDPVEGLPHPAFPVTIDGVTYHPQTEALLPWFSRPAKNTLSIGGAFSYPDTTTLPTASAPCTNP
ncbi:MAG TPA: hypothetical protein VEZ90_05140 [Blastocatellia bacterium]|nr:hypothetical protein [Blastocatellia bacterium]